MMVRGHLTYFQQYFRFTYHGCQSEENEVHRKNTDLTKDTDKLDHIQLYIVHLATDSY